MPDDNKWFLYKETLFKRGRMLQYVKHSPITPIISIRWFINNSTLWLKKWNDHLCDELCLSKHVWPACPLLYYVVWEWLVGARMNIQTSNFFLDSLIIEHKIVSICVIWKLFMLNWGKFVSDLIEVRLEMKLRQLFAKNVVLRKEDKKKLWNFVGHWLLFQALI